MIIVALGKLNLGNNFTYRHFIDALTETQIDRIMERLDDIDAEYKLIAKGNFGKIAVHTCGSDLADWLRQ